MAGPGGRQAGRLTIRVAPDTSNFAAELQTYLDRIEQRAEVQVEVNPDMTGFAAELRAQLARIHERVRVDVDTDTNTLRSLPNIMNNVGGAAGGASRHLSRFQLILRLLGASTPAIPAMASLTQSLTALAPAAALAAPALLGVATAGGALAVGFRGVGTALSGDFSKVTANAKSFAVAIRGLAPEWQKLQRSVQTTLFEGWGASVEHTAKSVLPALRSGLEGGAAAMNRMGLETMNSARQLADSGALGKAMAGANKGMTNLATLPGSILASIVKLSVGAAPAFDRVTAAMARGMESLSDKLSAGLESGGLTRAINGSIDAAKSLGAFLKDVGTIFSNVFGPAAEVGAGAATAIGMVADSLARVTSTAAAQEGLRAFWTILNQIGTLVGGVLSAALQAVMPLLSTLSTTLAGPIKTAVSSLLPAISGLVSALGAGLQPIIAAVSSTIAMLLPIVTQLVNTLASALGPVLTQVGTAIGSLVSTLAGALAPILAQLPALIGPVVAFLGMLFQFLVSVAQQLITALGPALKTIGTAFGEVLVALQPVVNELAGALKPALAALMPIISQIMPIIGALASLLANNLASAIKNIVVPAIRLIAALLRGDFSGAVNAAKALLAGLGQHFRNIFAAIGRIVSTAVSKVTALLGRMASQAVSKVRSMGASVVSAVVSAMSRFGSAISSGISRAVGFLRSLPGRARAALGNLGGVLVGAGRSLLNGFVRGIKSAIGSVKSTLGSITGMLPDWKGPAPLDARILTPNGRLVMSGFLKGIQDQVPALRSTLGGITAGIPAMVGTASVSGTFSSEVSGLQPGDRIVISPDGRQQFDAYVDRLADSRIRNGLAGPASLGRK